MSLHLSDLWEGGGARLGLSNFPVTIISKYNLDSIFMGGSEYIDFKTEFCFGGKLCTGKREYLREKVVGATSLGNARCFLLADDETTSGPVELRLSAGWSLLSCGSLFSCRAVNKIL